MPIAERLAIVLHTAEPVRRIECVDVSHTGGTATKVGVVVYDDGKPLKDAYRVWNIEGAHGDRFMRLSPTGRPKRLEHGEPWPDMVLVDGGKGQLAAVDKVFRDAFGRDENGASRVPFFLAGIAKARDERGHADRRAGNVADRIFVPGRSNPLPLREGSAECFFCRPCATRPTIFPSDGIVRPAPTSFQRRVAAVARRGAAYGPVCCGSTLTRWRPCVQPRGRRSPRCRA